MLDLVLILALNGVTLENYHKIELGMDKNQVVHILGRPSDNVPESERIFYWYFTTISEDSQEIKQTGEVWRSGKLEIWVRFDSSNRVNGTTIVLPRDIRGGASMCSAACPAQVMPEDPEGKTVADVIPQGHHHVQTQKLMALIQTRPGAKYSQAVVNEDVRRLFETKSFEDVRVRPEFTTDGKVIVYYIVKEMPVAPPLTPPEPPDKDAKLPEKDTGNKNAKKTAEKMFPDGLEHDFGKVQKGILCTHAFRVVNTSNVPLQIMSLRSS